MKNSNIDILPLNADNFKRYGLIIGYPAKRLQKKGNLFKIIVREPKSGWRIAYLIVRDKSIDKMESHPHSLESFEPCCGRALLFVSTGKLPDKIDCFLLNKPVVLKKGVWHAVVSISKESEIKITENSRVKCVYKKLKHSLNSSILSL